MQRYVHSESQVMATDLLLHERVPHGVIIESEELVEAAAA